MVNIVRITYVLIPVIVNRFFTSSLQTTDEKDTGTTVITLLSTVFAMLLLEFSARMIIGAPQKQLLPVVTVKPDPDRAGLCSR